MCITYSPLRYPFAAHVMNKISMVPPPSTQTIDWMLTCYLH